MAIGSGPGLAALATRLRAAGGGRRSQRSIALRAGAFDAPSGSVSAGESVSLPSHLLLRR